MYSVGSLAFLLISFICYWAYGSELSPNVIENLSGPKWVIALAYIAGAAQIIVSFHVSFWSCCSSQPACMLNQQGCMLEQQGCMLEQQCCSDQQICMHAT